MNENLEKQLQFSLELHHDLIVICRRHLHKMAKHGKLTVGEVRGLVLSSFISAMGESMKLVSKDDNDEQKYSILLVEKINNFIHDELRNRAIELGSILSSDA